MGRARSVAVPATHRSASIRATAASRGGSRSRRTDSTEVVAGVHRDVHAGHDLAVRVPYRGGDRPEALLQLLVHDGVSLPPDAAQLGPQPVR